MSRYIDSDLEAEIRSALRDGIPLEHLAGTLGIDATELRRLIGEPQWRDVPADDQD